MDSLLYVGAGGDAHKKHADAIEPLHRASLRDRSAGSGPSLCAQLLEYVLSDVPSSVLGGDADVPLAGVAIGNGLTRPREMTLSVPESYYAVGVLDAAQRDAAARLAADCVAAATSARQIARSSAASGAAAACSVDASGVRSPTRRSRSPTRRSSLETAKCTGWPRRAQRRRTSRVCACTPASAATRTSARSAESEAAARIPEKT